MRTPEKIAAAAVSAALIAVSFGLLWYVGHRSSPESAQYVNTEYGFNVELPGEWAGRYEVRELEQGSRTEFWFSVPGEEPEYMFEVGVTNDASWQVRLTQESRRVRELARRGSDVFYAHWAVSNPYQGETAVAYYRAMQLVPLALDSFQLLPRSRHTTEDKDTGTCIQVITRARDPRTGEEREFPTPCDVPQGWPVLPPELL